MLEDIGDVDTKSTFLPWQNMAIYRGGYRMPMARRLPPPLSTLPLPVCPWRAFYPSPVRISMARRPPVISHSGWATVKLGIDLGGVFSKAPELNFGRPLARRVHSAHDRPVGRGRGASVID